MNNLFKFQAQDSDLEYLFWRFWRVGSVTCQPIIAFSSVDLADIAIRTLCVHLFSPVRPTRKKRRKRRELDSPAEIVDLFLRAPMSSVAAAPKHFPVRAGGIGVPGRGRNLLQL